MPMPENALSVALYDQRESEARVAASYPALRAFSPVAFAQVNFPARVTHESELRRYADIMYEVLGREEWLGTRLFSREEAAAILRLSTHIEEVTGRLFGKPVQPLMCLFPSIPLLRMVEHLAKVAGRRLTVLEIGPGAGHLGALLLDAGHHLIAMDITQALYLWQNRLFEAVSGDFDEWAVLDATALPPPREPPARATHIPWWHFARFHELPALSITADVVICDAAIGEMDHFAFRYIARIAKVLTAQSDVGCFLYQNLGEERVHQRPQVEAHMSRLGFELYRVGGLTVLAGSRAFPTHAVARLKEPPPIGGSQEMLPPARFLRIDPAKLLESYRFFNFIGLGT
jgi:hypothetical protein